MVLPLIHSTPLATFDVSLVNYKFVGYCYYIAGVVVLVAVVILVSLFSVQHYGTDRVGWLFAPIVFLWFLSIASIGMYNIWKHDTTVLKAFSPVYIYRYFKRGGIDRWISLGGIMLSITGNNKKKRKEATDSALESSTILNLDFLENGRD